jgi:hypothetical protein
VPVTVGIVTIGKDVPALCATVDAALRSASLVGDDAEVLVVVNGRGRVPELDTVDSPMLRVRYLERPNVAAARNTVLAEARHDTILFTDDDCLVPPQWCAQMSAGLANSEYAAASAPVRMTVGGPISAYFDYQRIFDAVPAWPTDSSLLVTANCGVRRDRFPASIRFDARLNTAGEDTGFALELSKAGFLTGWLGDATPLEHGLSEELTEITARFERNARHSVHLYLTYGYAFASMPGLLQLHRQQIHDENPHDRQFAEILAPEARTAFAVYDRLAAAVGTVGYLDRMGTELGVPLIELDRDELNRCWHKIDEQVRACTARLTPADWSNLDVDFRSMPERLQPEPLLADIRDALRRYAKPVPDDPTGHIGEILNHGADDMGTKYLAALEAVRDAYDGLCAAPGPVTPDALARAVRGVNVPWTSAGNMIELSLKVNFRRWIRAARAKAEQ